MTLPPATSPAAFIRANTRLQPLAFVPEIRLHLAGEAVPLWQATEAELGRIQLPPPFWAFAWAGGQALARFVLDNAGEFAGRRVLDFASGSGLVAIAAAKAGAGVTAADIDPFAVAAIGLNATANAVEIAVEAADQLDRPPMPGVDVVMVGDVFYERDLAQRVLALLDRYAAAGVRVLVGDPGRSYLPQARLTALASYAVPVTREVEDHDVKQTSVFALTN
ncbi:class I SAM-dependent methyltransferase [Blastochloris viridis]|uniref:SAM-dependent methyltransferase n=2 Tax=Blastochloris viridis TaxID=1079 RepID=A0A182D028_BLAVI|nr:50S ribosomal protein L11 methyltransferase [Blastochloris viridis]BAR98789.1 SAM-dependent methyltransferase [Blastochloris viridis]